MTAGRGRQQDRYGWIGDEINSGKYTGYNDNLTNDVYNFGFKNAGYKTEGTDWEKYGTPDLNKIAASDTDKFDKKAAATDLYNDYVDYYINELVKNIKQSNSYDLTSGNFVNDLMNNSQNYVGDFLQNYFDDTYSQLEAAQKRGLLTDTSFNKGVDFLNNRNLQVTESLDDILSELIGNYGTAYEENAKDFEDKLTLGQSDLKTNINDKYIGGFSELSDINNHKSLFDNSYNINSLFSDFTNGALSSTNGLPFDISEIIANAKISSGINNVQSNELLQAIEDNEKQEEKKIGLGNQGVF